MSDMASILGLILLAFTWLALRGMGNDPKPRRGLRRPLHAPGEAAEAPAGPSHEAAP